MRIIIPILLTSLFIACTTDEGRLPKAGSQTGNIIIRVNQSLQADIYLDYRKTELRTPADVLTAIPSGRHVIHLKLANYRVEPDSHVVDLGDSQTVDIQFQLMPASSGNLSVAADPFAGVYLDRVLIGYANGQGSFVFNGIPAGDYVFGLKKSGYSECSQTISIASGGVTTVNRNLTAAGVIPVIEHFANTSCVPCPPTDEVLEAVLHDFGIRKVISLGYHANYPGPSDPMFLAASEANLSRLSYYSVSSVPYVAYNGKRINYYGNAARLNDSLRSKIPLESDRAAMVSLQIHPSFTADFETVSGIVRVETHQAICSQSKLRIALIERTIDYDQAPGTNGMTHFFDVMRAFYPSTDGAAVNTAAGQTTSVSYAFTRHASWGYDLFVVAFVQDDETKNIYQSAWTVYP